MLRVRCREGPNACFTRRCRFQFHGGPNPVPRDHGHGDTRDTTSDSTVDAPPWRRLIVSDRGSGDCPTIMSGQMLKLTPPGRTDARGSSDARANRPTAALGTALDVTAFRLLRWLRRSCRGSGDWTTTVWCQASGQMLKLTPPERTDAYGSSDVHADRAPSAARYGARSNGHCPATAWCQASGQMLKLTPPERTDAYESSDARADRVLDGAGYGAQSNCISVTVSAEAVGS
eukprot:6710066-Prymnesium_polylepis.4